MAKLETIKKELETVQELKNISNMLEQIAARDISSMRDRVLKSRPFFMEAWRIYDIVKQVTPEREDLLNKHLVIVITLNWGMVGNVMTRVIRKGEEIYNRYEADMLITGKMGQNRFSNLEQRTIHFFDVPKKASYTDIEPLKKIIARYAHVHFVYPQYEKLSHQKIAVSSMSNTVSKTEKSEVDVSKFLFEPNPQEISKYLSEAIIGVVLFSYFSESLLAYSSAQMVSMRRAHDNAKDEEERLQLRYNKAKGELVSEKLREIYENKFTKGKA